MRFFTAFRFATVLLAPLVVSAAPLQRSTDPNTLLVLNFAFVLEQLETQFYQEGLSKFKSNDFSSAGFTSAEVAIEEITVIQGDEASHVTAIQEILIAFGAKPPSGCKFDFSSALVDVSTMVTIARIVENVGVGAYLGAAHLIEDPRILTAAASILTIESRHQTVLNLFEGGAAISQPFDIPLLPNEVLAIAGSFISGCDLGVPANPSLSVTNTGPIGVGTSLQFKSPALNSSTSGFHCQMLTGGMPFSLSLPIDECNVPEGISGAVVIWITSDDQALNGLAVDRQSNAIVAGPLITFIDIKIDIFAELVRTKGKSGSSESGSGSSYSPPMSSDSASASTTTVSPSQASEMVSGLSLSTVSMDMTSASSSASTASASATASQSGSGSQGAIANGITMVPKPTSSSS